MYKNTNFTILRTLNEILKRLFFFSTLCPCDVKDERYYFSIVFGVVWIYRIHFYLFVFVNPTPRPLIL